MNTSRRGFLGMLGGLLAGTLFSKVVQVSTPLPELFQAIPKLPLPPVEHYFVPLEVVAGEVLNVMERELKWLRLKTLNDNSLWISREARLGDSVMVREPMKYDLRPQSYEEMSRAMVCGHRAITIGQHSKVELDLREYDWKSPYSTYSERIIEPLAHGLVENVISGIRRAGGGDYLVMPKLQNPAAGHNRSVVLTSQETGMSVRAVEWTPYDRPHRPRLVIDTMYGVG